MTKYNYPGAIHIHTKYSDGTGDIDTITKAAKKSGLEWIIVTDHNNMDIDEGIFNDIYVLKGEEISEAFSNHYIALNVDNIINQTDPNDFLKEIQRNNGFGFVAHPHEQTDRKNSFKPIRWTSDTTGIQGVEIWNWFSQWADNYNDTNILTMAYSYFFRNNLISKPYKETLKLWDELNENSGGIVPAIGGIDAHALIVKKFFIPFEIFPYTYLFKTITNEIFLNEPLSENFEEAKQQILNSLRNGKNIIVNRYVNKHVPIIIIMNAKNSISSGEHVALDNETYLYVKLPRTGNINVIKDGVIYNKFNQKEIKLKISEPGKYRVEIVINGKGYAYSNPMRVVKG